MVCCFRGNTEMHTSVLLKSRRKTTASQRYLHLPEGQQNIPQMIPTNNKLLIPFLSIVDSKYFQNLLEKLNPKYQFPSRKHLSTKLIQEKSTEIRNELKENLAKAISVCLTIDIWSNRQMRGFLGITGHYIHKWQMKSVMICCKRFK